MHSRVPDRLRDVVEAGDVIALGAESLLVRHDWLGLLAVYKIRLPKPYRHPSLDERLRRLRTRREARALIRLPEMGVPTPTLYEVDLDLSLLITEYIPGRTLKQATESSFDPDHYRKLGKLVGRMHEHGFVHYDLTTSNILVSGDDLYIIDLGLSEDSDDPEDHAVDLRVFERCLESSHPEVKEEAWRAFLRGYREEREEATDTVLRALEDLKSRVRYI
ncbi:KEOPS complex kinase/ATPase Bud32 [Methanopyrus kandleri]|uniref:non-specific serine/threonine protein kinase n=1 Tax=Methanopyrus kandleri TaxID=2320 RepID=A0A832WLA5_9EURY|nr:KEOPS complex kinase/ATPase Bud32 [Methanopyrus kandleri]HII70925.1 Kae1-associated serine/threonine protein kinase [Methanopyrus kandleri]